jgi:hypothetical protein
MYQDRIGIDVVCGIVVTTMIIRYDAKKNNNPIKVIMALTVAGLWTVWIIVLVALFIILWIVFALASRCKSCSGLNWAAALLWGAIIAGLVVFIAAFWVNIETLSPSDLTSINVLFLVAFIVPVFIALLVMWAAGSFSWRACGCKKADPCAKPDPCAKTDPCPKPAPPCDPCNNNNNGHAAASSYNPW